jgi:NAD(P)H-flavin reductase
VPGGRFSESVLAGIQKGDKLEIELPYGDFYLRTGSERSVVCLATGTGFAPLKSIIENLLKHGNVREVRLYWGGRRRQDLYMVELAEKWAARASWLTFVPVLSEPDPNWNGAVGLVHQAVLNDLIDLSGWQVYACGNPMMIRSARRDFEAFAGLPADQFFADPFVASGSGPAPAR